MDPMTLREETETPRTSGTPGTEKPAALEPTRIVSHIETDRYCAECGYNLRTQPVWRDDRTRILLARCPECGGFAAIDNATTATSPWLNRVATLFLFIWILAVLWAFVGLSFAQGAVIYTTLEELTRWSSGRELRVVAAEFEYYELFMAVVGGGSSALGFVALGLITIVCHHWRRRGYVILAIFQCTAVTAVVWAMWFERAPYLVDWALQYILGLALLSLIGALGAVWLGRPFARLVVRMVLPPRAQCVLAFLWLTDGLQPPRIEAPTAAPAAMGTSDTQLDR